MQVLSTLNIILNLPLSPDLSDNRHYVKGQKEEEEYILG